MPVSPRSLHTAGGYLIFLRFFRTSKAHSIRLNSIRNRSYLVALWLFFKYVCCVVFCCEDCEGSKKVIRSLSHRPCSRAGLARKQSLPPESECTIISSRPCRIRPGGDLLARELGRAPYSWTDGGHVFVTSSPAALLAPTSSTSACEDRTGEGPSEWAASGPHLGPSGRISAASPPPRPPLGRLSPASPACRAGACRRGRSS